MALIKAFNGIRPLSQYAMQFASRPYDVMSRAELPAESHPNSFLRVIRSEVDLPDTIGDYDPLVYATALQNLNDFIQKGILVQDSKPHLYIYTLIMDGIPQTGIFACSSVDDYMNDRIKKHEFTRPEKEKDRITHNITLRTHTEPVFLAYRKLPAIDRLVTQITDSQIPDYDFTTADGIRHILYSVQNTDLIQQITDLFRTQVPATYIADGHHRTASAAKAALHFRAQNPNHHGEEEYNYFLSVLFPHDQLRIMPYNRVIKDLNGNTPEQFLQQLQAHFEISLAPSPYQPVAPYHYGLYINRQWYCLIARPHTYADADAINRLDVSVLSNYVLAPLLGIADQRTDKRIDFVGGIRGLSELEKRVDSGEMAAAFSFYPVSMSQLLDVADAGEVMPPKSTWFEPKLRSGLVLHSF